MKKFILFILICGVTLMQADADEERMIKPPDVNIRNYEEFVSQLSKDLPVGTSMQQVTEYLSARGIRYSNIVDDEGCIKFMIKKIYSAFFVFKTDLQVRIFLTDDEGVSEIKSKFIETAF